MPDLFVEATTASKQVKLTAANGITNFFMHKAAREQFAARQQPGEAVTFEEELASVALEVKELPSEKAPPPPTPKPVFGCEHCSKTFNRPCELAGHALWKHPSQPRGLTMPTKQFRGSLAVSLTVDADCHVRLALCINGKDQKQIRSEAEAQETAMEAAKIEREMESHRRCQRRIQLRLAQAEMGEQRRGSAHHQTYTAPEKARLLDLIDQIYANPSVLNKGGAFEDDRRSRGCPYKTVEKWMKAAERRKIAVGCAHTHAKTLLRIDKNSRKVGKYAGMERTLFTNFKQRRARARKTSTKWLVHMAKHIMRIDYPEHALDFQGSKGWAQRFKRRWSICTRKKTNAKNTTWEETEPKLQAYFRTFRRRLRDPAWWEQYKADALAAATPLVDDAVEAEGDVGRQHA